MGLEELKAIQVFISEQGWAVSPKITFNQEGNGFFHANWCSDRIYVAVTIDGMLTAAEEMNDKGLKHIIFRRRLSDPICLERFSHALKWIWK